MPKYRLNSIQTVVLWFTTPSVILILTTYPHLCVYHKDLFLNTGK